MGVKIKTTEINHGNLPEQFKTSKTLRFQTISFVPASKNQQHESHKTMVDTSNRKKKQIQLKTSNPHSIPPMKVSIEEKYVDKSKIHAKTVRGEEQKHESHEDCCSSKRNEAN